MDINFLCTNLFIGASVSRSITDVLANILLRDWLAPYIYISLMQYDCLQDVLLFFTGYTNGRNLAIFGPAVNASNLHVHS